MKKMNLIPIITVLILAIAAIGVFLYLDSGSTAPKTSIPVVPISDLPPEVQRVVVELQKDEYIGLTEEEISRKLDAKGIPH